MLVSLAVAAVGQGGVSSGKPDDMRLRLADLPAGYQVDTEGGCGPLLPYEGTPADLAPFLRSTRPNGCEFEFDRNWTTSRHGTTPALVETGIVVFSSPADAQAAFARRSLFIRYLLHATNTHEFPRLGVGIGDESRLIGAGDVLIRGQAGRGMALVSRQSAVLSIVLAGGGGTAATVIDLAKKQSRRIADPTPVAPGEAQRSPEVPLDNPRLPVSVVWLGRTFAAPRGLRLRLFQADAAEQPFGPGGVVKMDYQATSGRPLAGLHLDLWTPVAFNTFSKTRLGRLVWSSPCAKRKRVGLHTGFALLYGGYSRPASPPCPTTVPNHYLAHVYFKGVVAAVDTPYCFCCAGLPRNDPFNSFSGLEAVVRALRPR